MISVIVLLEEQHQEFPDFIMNLEKVFSGIEKDYEIIIIANGTGNFFRSLQDRFNGLEHKIRAFEFGTRVPQAVCLKAILNEARGEVLAVFGSYQQLTDESIEQCVHAIYEQGVDIISPRRENRVDPAFNQLQSRVFNWMVRRFVGTQLHDFSCTVKLCRRSVMEEVELYGNMFRFLPVLASLKGFKIRELPVTHYQERGKAGFYRLSVYVSRILDIFTLFFNTRYSRKPLRFFSAAGLTLLAAGVFILAVLFAQKIFFAIPIGNRPFLFVSFFTIILGVLVSSAGLLGEIIAFTNGRHKKEYVIEKEI
ncbi:MAG: glycosyltransferase [Desulfosalsimonas sp.]